MQVYIKIGNNNYLSKYLKLIKLMTISNQIQPFSIFMCWFVCITFIVSIGSVCFLSTNCILVIVSIISLLFLYTYIHENAFLPLGASLLILFHIYRYIFVFILYILMFVFPPLGCESADTFSYI